MSATNPNVLPMTTPEGLLKEVPSCAIGMGLHEVTAYEMSMTLRTIFDSLPKSNFADLHEDGVYCYRSGSYSSHTQVFSVVKVTPNKNQAVVRMYGRTDPIRIFKGSYSDGTFTKLNETLIALLGISHRQIIETALDLSLEIPPRVRREYPELFIAIPDRFAKPVEWGAETAASRIKKALEPPFFSRDVIDATTVQKWIDETHDERTRWLSEKIRRVAVNPDTAPDYDRQEAEFHELIDFYRWLLPRVAPGGVLYVEPQGSQAAI